MLQLYKTLGAKKFWRHWSISSFNNFDPGNKKLVFDKQKIDSTLVQTNSSLTLILNTTNIVVG